MKQMFLNQEIVKKLRIAIQPGAVVILHRMKGENMPLGLKGKVTNVDDAGQIHVNWENGSSLALILDEDEFSIMIRKAKLSYFCRDSGNYKSWQTATFLGHFSEKDIQTIEDSMNPEFDGFIPSQIGLPDEREWDYDPECDQPWWEFNGTNNFPMTVNEKELVRELKRLSTTEIVEAFTEAKGNWVANI